MPFDIVHTRTRSPPRYGSVAPSRASNTTSDAIATSTLLDDFSGIHVRVTCSIEGLQRDIAVLTEENRQLWAKLKLGELRDKGVKEELEELKKKMGEKETECKRKGDAWQEKEASWEKGKTSMKDATGSGARLDRGCARRPGSNAGASPPNMYLLDGTAGRRVKQY